MFSTTLRWHRGNASLSGLAMLLLISGVLPLAAKDYFVRPTGNDEAKGTSTNAAWQTIERVNRARFEPGDRVRFEANTSFAGNLLLPAEDAGTSNAPVVIGSFGEGRATILAGRQTGITVESSSAPGAPTTLVMASAVTTH
jgi:hypothetical protein